MNNNERSTRLGGLRRFAVAITVLNVLGHTIFGFEQAWLVPFVAIATAYSIEFLFEFTDSRLNNRAPLYAGDFRQVIDFLLSAHITALACGMLLYAGGNIWPIVFAVAVAMGSKALFRVNVSGRSFHFLNPSNFGITVTLLTFPWVGIVPPYHFTENLGQYGDWVLPGIIVASGTFLNMRFTGRLPLIVAWLGGFVLQALLRSWAFGVPVTSTLVPMTGLAFVLYTFYMVTDPATTPNGTKAQILFGASVAAAYAFLVLAHIVFGLFIALSIVCILRGFCLTLLRLHRESSTARVRETVLPTAVNEDLVRVTAARK
ncbi:MAG TPA: enediyne biosynthesis protein UnbU [Blastocatellia bacterium]|nr:enediyne biosynthesis protein UnbU [Blastocatellia bacterium]